MPLGKCGRYCIYLDGDSGIAFEDVSAWSGKSFCDDRVSALDAGSVCPVESIQYMEKVSAGRKSKRQSKDPLKAMAWRNLFRFRKRCVLTIVSLTLGICVALSAVVITKGTDMTNQIEAENHDFKIMTKGVESNGRLWQVTAG